MSDERITIDDVRRAGHCVKGARKWFDSYGLDFRTFLKEGISEEDFLATGDGIAAEIVMHKKQNEARRG